MVEYTCEDAIKLLNKSKESAESRLRETNVRNWLHFHTAHVVICVPHPTSSIRRKWNLLEAILLQQK